MDKRIKMVMLLALGHLANDFYPGLLGPLLPFFTAKYGWSLAQAGFLITVMQSFCNFTQPVMGIINDHKPRKFFLWTGILISGLPFLFILHYPSFKLMALAMVISGIGVGMFHPIAAVAAGRIAVEKRRDILMAVFSSGGHIAFMIAPVITVSIIEHAGERYMPVVVAPAIIMAVYFFLNSGMVVDKRHGLSLRGWIESLVKNGRTLLVLWIISLFRAIVSVLINSFLPLLAMARGSSYTVSAYILSATLLASMVGMFVGGYLADIHGRRKVMGIALFITTPLLYGFMYTSGTLSVILLLFGMATLASSLPINIILAQQAVPKTAGMASSLIMGLSFGIGGLAATPFGMLADRVGIETAMSVPLFLPVLGGITTLFMKDR